MPYKWQALIAVCFGTYMATMDISIVNVALPTLRREFAASYAGVEWIVAGYLLVISATLLALGRLARSSGVELKTGEPVYQIEPETLTLLKSFGTSAWDRNLEAYLVRRKTLATRYAKERELNRVPVQINPDKKILLSPGEHSTLIKAVIEEFAPRFVPGGVLIYAGDTGDKWGYFDDVKLAKLGVTVDSHGKMPDVVLYYPERGWLLLVESVTSHGPVDSKRHEELARLFDEATPGLVYVTAFPNRSTMARYLPEIAWETEVWVADAPSHLIHFNGVRFLGPYTKG